MIKVTKFDKVVLVLIAIVLAGVIIGGLTLYNNGLFGLPSGAKAALDDEMLESFDSYTVESTEKGDARAYTDPWGTYDEVWCVKVDTGRYLKVGQDGYRIYNVIVSRRGSVWKANIWFGSFSQAGCSE